MLAVNDRVRIKANGRFGIAVNVDLTESHGGVTVLTYCDFVKYERPQWFTFGQLSVGDALTKERSLSEELELLLGAQNNVRK